MNDPTLEGPWIKASDGTLNISTNQLSGTILKFVACLCLVLGILPGCDTESGSETPTASPGATSEGTPIAGPPSEVDLGTDTALVWGSGDYGVVLVHGAIYDAASWTNQAEAIADNGFPVFAVEQATTDNVRTAMDHLARTFGTTHVALIGASAGTGPVVDVASNLTDDALPAVDLVVILAGSARVDALDVPSVLFISAEGDGGAAAAAERMMSEISGDPSDLLIVPGSAHAQALFNEPEGEIVLTAIKNRLDARKATVQAEP